MGRRQYKRLRLALPVVVSGTDAAGNPFTQSALTAEISADGMRIGGVRCFRAAGDLVEVRYKGRRARFKVAWFGQAGTSADGMAGLEAVPDTRDSARRLFADHLRPDMRLGPDPALDAYVVPDAAPASDQGREAQRQQERRREERRQEERRRYVRFPCAGSARIWEGENAYAVAGRVNEISMGGCYVEMMAPMPVGAAVRLELEISGPAIRVQAVVRTSQPAFGMGLEFTRVAPAELEKLHRAVAQLSGESSRAEPAGSAAAEFDGASAKELAEAMLRWFESHDVLSRQEFVRIVEYLQRAATEGVHA